MIKGHVERVSVGVRFCIFCVEYVESEIGSSLGLDYQGADPESGYLMLFIYFLQAVWDLTELCQGPAVGLLCGQQC